MPEFSPFAQHFGPGSIRLSSVLSINDSSRDLLVEILNALNPYYADDGFIGLVDERFDFLSQVP